MPAAYPMTLFESGWEQPAARFDGWDKEKACQTNTLFNAIIYLFSSLDLRLYVHRLRPNSAISLPFLREDSFETSFIELNETF